MMVGSRMPTPSLRLSHLRLASKRSASSGGGSSLSESPSILRNPLQWYITKLDTHPITTKGITSGLISGSGDLLCQSIIANKRKETTSTTHEFDWMRTLRFTILGSFLVAPTVHLWYGMLMRRIPGTGVSAIAKRLFCDQGLFAPLFTPTFIATLTVLEHLSSPLGQNHNQEQQHDAQNNNDDNSNQHNSDLYTHLTDRFKNDVPDAILVGWSMWVPSMAVMFAVVPVKFQVLYSNCVGFVWNAYLSWRTHEGEVERS
jgi:hypothetical protein